MLDDLTFDMDTRYGLAFSGGVDSSYLLAEMVRRGVDVKAYFVKTAFQSPDDLDDAREMAARLAVPFETIRADVLSHDEICANPSDRCYHCKRFIFGNILEHMAADGRTVLVDGTNATDSPARRPGFRALAELGVRSPLREAGYTKDDVREESRKLGLFTADKPNFACYAVHVPEGERITASALGKVVLGDAEPYEFINGARRVIFSAPHGTVHVRDGRLKPAETDTGIIARELNDGWGFPVLIKTGNADDDPNFCEQSAYRDELAKRVEEFGAVAIVDVHQMVHQHGVLVDIGTGHGENLWGKEQLVRAIEQQFEEAGISPVGIDSKFAAAGAHTVSADISHRCGIPCFQLELNSSMFLPRLPEYCPAKVTQVLAEIGKMLERELS